MHIGNAVRAVMALRRKSIKGIADTLGITPQAVHKALNRDDWKITEIDRYADAIGSTREMILSLASKA